MEVKVRQYSLRPNSPNGYMISLPIEWVRDLELEKGEIMEVFRNEKDDLIIRPKERKDA